MVTAKACLWSAWTAVILALAGCVAPSGPVFGDWRGRQLGDSITNPVFVNLVLHGSPGDQRGSYDFQAQVVDPTLSGPGNHTLIWGDQWSLTQSGAPGAPPILELHNLPASQISRYALLPNGLLVPVNTGSLPASSRYNLHYALQPVPKQSSGYGRI